MMIKAGPHKSSQRGAKKKKDNWPNLAYKRGDRVMLVVISASKLLIGWSGYLPIMLELESGIRLVIV